MAAALPALLPIAGSLIGKLVGGKKKTEAAVPKDVSGMRQNQIGLMNYLLGFGPPPAGMHAPSGSGGQHQPFQQGQYGGIGGATQPNFGNQHPLQFGGQQAPSQDQLPWYMQSGGQGGLPGPHQDTVPAMLRPGEMVLTPEQQGGLFGFGNHPVQHFFSGGIVQPTPDILLRQQQNQMRNQQAQAPQGVGGAVQPGFGQQTPLNFGGGVPNIGASYQPQPGGLNQYNGMQNAGFGQAPPPISGGQTPIKPPGSMVDDRLQSYFGNLGVNASGLQNQASQGISQYLNKQSPEQRAMEAAYPFLQNVGGTQQGTLGGFYNQNLNNPQAGGPGSDVDAALAQFMQTGGYGGQGGNQGLSNQLQAVLGQLLTGGGPGASQSQIAGSSALQKLATNNPGQGVVDALNPLFSRHLAEANQEGGRFGSANAIMRSRAVDDYNLLAQQALQQGVSQQIQAASQLGQGGGGGGGGGGTMDAVNAAMHFLDQQAGNRIGSAQALGGLRQSGFGNQLQNANQYGNLGLGALGTLGSLAGQQGQNEFQRLLGAHGAGQAETGQGDVETQRRLNLIQGLMGGAQGASMNVPTTQTPSGAEQGAQFGGGLAQLLMQSGMFGGNGGQQGGGQQQPFDINSWLNQQGNARK